MLLQPRTFLSLIPISSLYSRLATTCRLIRIIAQLLSTPLDKKWDAVYIMVPFCLYYCSHALCSLLCSTAYAALP